MIAADLRPDVFLWVCMMDIAVDQGFLRQRLPSKDVSTTRALDRYDPTYDPLLASTPGCGQDYSPTYWIATAGEPPADDGPIDSDREVDVAIIGSGFTGLSAAIALARDHGVRATVLEANRVSWGCSVRNGGQAQCASGRLTRSQWIARWGLDTALALHAECLDGMEYFKRLIADIDCDVQPGGHLYVAHRAARMPMLEREAKVLREVFNYDAQIMDADTLRRHYIDDHEAAGAMHEPEGLGVHPAKLAFGYLKKARALGATVHPASPVQGWVTKDGWHHLQTPGGVVRARAVGVATGGYTSQTLHPRLRNRLMPILSNSVVTRQLTPEEIEANGLRTHQVITDTRVLRHYYRLTPDGRLQIGSRSAITGRGAPDKRYERMLLDGMVRKFPGLRDVSIDFLVGLGGCQPRHDAAHRAARPSRRHLLRAWLWWQWRDVRCPGRSPPGAVDCRRRWLAAPAHLPGAAAFPQRGRRHHIGMVCAIPAAWPAGAVPLVSPEGRSPVTRPSTTQRVPAHRRHIPESRPGRLARERAPTPGRDLPCDQNLLASC